MKQSHLFTKTRREAPKDEVSKNAQLLIRGGFIHKEMAGVYSLLPLGVLVMNNIVAIIREEMNKIGGQEIFLTALQDKSVWEKTSRWSDKEVDIWFKTSLKNNTELGLGFTHEEPLTNLMRDHIRSFRDLPIYPYQIQTKFRNETRAKSGIMRGREFLMKDLYSFSKDVAEHEAFYEKVKSAYKNIFARVGLGDKTYLTYASGGSFSKYSHEFQTITSAGEDTIHVCEKCHVAVNDEIFAEMKKCPQCNATDLRIEKAVEVGNIFSLGTRFSDALELTYLDQAGNKQAVVMGSYGIGPTRLLGTIVETLSDENGIVWPEEVAPFDIHLVSLDNGKVPVKETAERFYADLTANGASVLLDDRDARAGEKFTDSDLLGIPLRIVVSEKTMNEGVVELKNRKTGEVRKVPHHQVVDVSLSTGEDSEDTA